MSGHRSRDGGLWQVFRWPLLLAVASLVGLVAALVGDGGWDLLSWACLGSLPALVFYLLTRR